MTILASTIEVRMPVTKSLKLVGLVKKGTVKIERFETDETHPRNG